MPTNPAVSARVPDNLQRRAKAKAALKGQSYGDYLADLIEADTRNLEQELIDLTTSNTEMEANNAT